MLYGGDYHLSRKEDTSWVEVPYVIDNWAFTAEGYIAESNNMVSIDINWEWLYGSLPAGTYLLTKRISIPKSDSSYDHKNLEIQFVL